MLECPMQKCVVLLLLRSLLELSLAFLIALASSLCCSCSVNDGTFSVTFIFTTIVPCETFTDTQVVFAMDKGGPTHICGIQGSSNYPKRGGKCTLCQRGATRDAFISWRALSGSNRTPPHLSHDADWLPTLAAAVGGKPNGDLPLDGVNHLKALRTKKKIDNADNDDNPPPPWGKVFGGHAYIHTQREGWHGPSIQHRQWKLIQGGIGGPKHPKNMPNGAKEPAQMGNASTVCSLCDLLFDPNKWHGIATENPKVVQLPQKKLRVYRETCAPPKPKDDPTCTFQGLNSTPPSMVWWCPENRRAHIKCATKNECVLQAKWQTIETIWILTTESKWAGWMVSLAVNQVHSCWNSSWKKRHKLTAEVQEPHRIKQRSLSHDIHKPTQWSWKLTKQQVSILVSPHGPCSTVLWVEVAVLWSCPGDASPSLHLGPTTKGPNAACPRF